MTNSTIIIPDVHGRTFWKDAVKGREDMNIIFLGDYIDPYPHENIDEGLAFDRFKEIIEFKREHMENVTLLLGNHDIGPYVFSELFGCRTNYSQEIEIRNYYLSNIDLFKFGTYLMRNNTTFLFTHSFMAQQWTDSVISNEPIVKDDRCEVIDYFNAKLMDATENNSTSSRKFLTKSLQIVSRYRGGWAKTGSMVWADVHEFYPVTDYHKNEYMIFGHSQQAVDPIVTDKFACLDCRRAFILNEQGEITELDGTKVPHTNPEWLYDDEKEN